MAVIFLTSEGETITVDDTAVEWMTFDEISQTEEEWDGDIYRLNYSFEVLKPLVDFCERNGDKESTVAVRILLPEFLLQLIEAAHLLEIQMLVDLACSALVRKLDRAANQDIREREGYALRGQEFTNNILRRDRAAMRTYSGRFIPSNCAKIDDFDDSFTKERGPTTFAVLASDMRLSMMPRNPGDPDNRTSCLLRYANFLRTGYDLEGVVLPLSCRELAFTLANEVLNIGEVKSHAKEKLDTCCLVACLMGGHYIPLPQNMLTRLSEFISIESENWTEEKLVGSALFVIGNIVRWGSDEERQFLTTQCNILPRVGRVLTHLRGDLFVCKLSIKPVLCEACRIIAILAAESATAIKSMYVEAEIVQPLRNLLLGNGNGDSDEQFLEKLRQTKVEAAWALFYVCGFLY